ncbi:MAG: hypothetical protein H7061_01050 [Bdellovibrionaceae bacterium]|nr:hypothetical protein [Bdellovibrio sp.]
MSRSAYFVLATVIGYLCAGALGYQLWGAPFWSIFTMTAQNNGIVPIAAGIFTSLLIAYFLFGRKVKAINFWVNGLIAPLAIFVPGAVVGCLFNMFLNSSMAGYYDWFLKPAAWISYLGSVYSLILGVLLYFSVFRPFVKK